jgi:hypothetical protein
MTIPLIKGRDFSADELGIAIVNREFAREHFPGDPIGKWFDAEPGGEWGRHFQIVGELAARVTRRSVTLRHSVHRRHSCSTSSR